MFYIPYSAFYDGCVEIVQSLTRFVQIVHFHASCIKPALVPIDANIYIWAITDSRLQTSLRFSRGRLSRMNRYGNVKADSSPHSKTFGQS